MNGELLPSEINRSDLFRGELVRLSQAEPEALAKEWASWDRDSLLQRLMNDSPPSLYSVKRIKESIEKENEDRSNSFFFSIHTLEDERLIGFVDLGDIHWTHGEGWVGIGIGRRSDWGRGYGTDAMRLMLRFAFDELNLHRVTLGVFSYNLRAIRSYEKAGFVMEGVERGSMFRDGRRTDIIYMGALQANWNARRRSA